MRTRAVSPLWVARGHRSAQSRLRIMVRSAQDGSRRRRIWARNRPSPWARSTPAATNSYSRSPRMAGSKSISPHSRHVPSGSSAEEQMLAHDLGVQQYGRDGRQCDRIEATTPSGCGLRLPGRTCAPPPLSASSGKVTRCRPAVIARPTTTSTGSAAWPGAVPHSRGVLSERPDGAEIKGRCVLNRGAVYNSCHLPPGTRDAHTVRALRWLGGVAPTGGGRDLGIGAAPRLGAHAACGAAQCSAA